MGCTVAKDEDKKGKKNKDCGETDEIADES
jgi:hypothetical protein